MEDKNQSNKQKKIEDKPAVKKTAIVNGNDLGISKKDSMAICDMIRGKTIETAIKMLEEVKDYKRVVRMNNRELAHKHGKRVMAGRYPIKASEEFIRLLKQLNANAIFLGVEQEKYVLFCKANKATRPYRRGGRRFKRTHVTLKLEQTKVNIKNKNKEVTKK